MSSVVSIAAIFVALTALATQSHGRLPGFKIRITKHGIDYANTVAHDKLADELKTLKIPDQSGSEGHVSWSISNIQNRGCTVPATSMTLSPSQNGLTWAMSNLGIILHTDWRVKYKKGWVKISNSGSVDIDVRGVRLSATISLGADSTGRPTISLAACSAAIGDVHLSFHGGTAFILNLFKGTLERKVKDLMKDQICKVIQKEVNGDGAEALKKLKMNVTLEKHFRLDYGLIQSPEVQSNYLETEHKGEVYWNGDSTEAPFSPKAFPALSDDTRMMYLWVSQYTANSMAYTAQKHDFLKYNLTAKDLPPDSRSFLNTTCKLKCIGTVIPQIGQAYPKSQVEVRIASTSTPVTTLAKSSLTIDTRSNVSLYAHTPSNKTAFLLTLDVKLSLTLEASVVDERLTGKITNHKFKLAVLESAVGKVSSSGLNFILGAAMTIVVIPDLNEIAKKGVDLPVTGSIKLINTSIDQLDGSILIATDLQQLKSVRSRPLKFRSEGQRL